MKFFFVLSVVFTFSLVSTFSTTSDASGPDTSKTLACEVMTLKSVPSTDPDMQTPTTEYKTVPGSQRSSLIVDTRAQVDGSTPVFEYNVTMAGSGPVSMTLKNSRTGTVVQSFAETSSALDKKLSISSLDKGGKGLMLQCTVVPTAPSPENQYEP